MYVFGSGQKYEGAWQKGKKHGWSIYTVETGQRWAGSWVEGKPQWVHPVGVAAALQQEPPAEEGAGPEVADNLSHAMAACKNAQEVRRMRCTHGGCWLCLWLTVCDASVLVHDALCG